MATFTVQMGLPQPANGSKNAGENYNDALEYIDLGRTHRATLGEAMSENDAAYIASDSKAYRLQASASSTDFFVGLCTEEGATDEQRYFRISGWTTDSGWSWNPGETVYVATDVTGGLSQTEPADSDATVIVGMAYSATEVWIQPQKIISNVTQSLNFTSLTGTDTLTISDDVAFCNGTFTVTLPSATVKIGKTYNIKNMGSGTITVDGDGAETIDGETTQVLSQYDCITILSSGTEWGIL